MKIKIDDDMLDSLIIKRLKSDAKRLNKSLTKMDDRFASLSEAELRDYMQMQRDFEAIVKVLDYYGALFK